MHSAVILLRANLRAARVSFSFLIKMDGSTDKTKADSNSLRVKEYFGNALQVIINCYTR